MIFYLQAAAGFSESVNYPKQQNMHKKEQGYYQKIIYEHLSFSIKYKEIVSSIVKVCLMTAYLPITLQDMLSFLQHPQ